MIFVDTSGWFAWAVPKDTSHRAAVEWFEVNSELLCTSDYVVDETLTLLRARGEAERALSMAESYFSGEIATLHYLTEADILEAWRVFVRFSDKEWSFTDCTSKVLMERLGIAQAFAFDEHFRQFGTLTVFP